LCNLNFAAFRHELVQFPFLLDIHDEDVEMLYFPSATWWFRNSTGRTAAALTLLLVFVESFYYLGFNPLPRFLPSLRSSYNVYGRPISKEPLPLPSIYSKPPYMPEQCQRRYGVRYIEEMVQTKRPYCEATDSASQMFCFQTDVADGRVDAFCTASGVILPPESEKFEIDCQLRDWANSTDLQGRPQIVEFRQDWYETGPGFLFPNFVNVGKGHTATIEECRTANATASHTILIKRESNYNLWHSLMEIMSYTMTMDTLSMSTDENGEPLFSTKDAETSEVLVLDDGPTGQYFDLWNLIAKRPTLRRSDLKTAELSCRTNLIIPLSGATNPMWLGDWTAIECKESRLFDAFIERVMGFYEIDPIRDEASPLVLTFIDRKGTRRLEKQDELILALRTTYPNITINVVDFAAINLQKQIRIISNTDILAGVHGAGLTHAMWLPHGSALVEIQPMDVLHKGFRNVAALRGVKYFSTHALQQPDEEPGNSENKDWHFMNIFIEKDRFMGVMDAAIKSMYHRGVLDFDVL
jgi:EGF domain-specific O-GlcNAc transferase